MADATKADWHIQSNFWLVLGLFTSDSKPLTEVVVLKELLFELLEGNCIPILANLPSSHVDPILSLPLGQLVKLESGGRNSLTVLRKIAKDPL